VRQLADWGADVIKIESPAGGDADLFGDHRGSSDFQNLQRNKRSCTLNLKSAEGVAIFKRLAQSADVVVENFRPDVKTRLGISYPDLRTANPRLVYASISGFGEDGPYRARPGFDQIAQGMGGLMSITGLPGQGPVRAGIPVADLSAGILCAQGILLALFDRERTGEGQWVTTSLLQAQVFMLDFQATRWLDDGVVPEQAGNSHPTYSLTGVFTTADGWINIAASGQAMWEGLCRVLGEDADDDRAQLANPAFATPQSRLEHRDEVTEAVNSLLSSNTSAHWLRRLNEAGVPSGPINTVDQVFADPQVQHLGMVEEIPSPYFDPLRVVGQPFRLSGTESAVRLRPPEHGEHTDEILATLGYTAEAIAGLRERGVV
jgi:crotonobetainyl-CoA:carnitine CoA-transferase CaiB-like acyl-CoA transferase